MPRLDPISHLAVWPALYVSAGVVFFLQLAAPGRFPVLPGRLLAFALLTALGCYLLDRVKLHDGWLDPADQAAHPARYGFLAARAGRVRAAALLALAAGAIVGWWLPSPTAGLLPSHWAALLPAFAGVGVIVYARKGRTTRDRPKDILLLKNAYVAGGVTAFALLAGLAASHEPAEIVAGPWAWWGVLGAGAALFTRVLADAALCDLDDQHADAAHGTTTLATRLGRHRAWNLALVLRLVLAVGLAAVPFAPWKSRWAWSAVTILSSLLLRASRPVHLRDWVDARFPVEALIVSGFLAWMGGG